MDGCGSYRVSGHIVQRLRGPRAPASEGFQDADSAVGRRDTAVCQNSFGRCLRDGRASEFKRAHRRMRAGLLRQGEPACRKAGEQQIVKRDVLQRGASNYVHVLARHLARHECGQWRKWLQAM
jgi:hypothetical protein